MNVYEFPKLYLIVEIYLDFGRDELAHSPCVKSLQVTAGRGLWSVVVSAVCLVHLF